MIVLAVAVGLFIVWRIIRRRRSSELAGRNVEKPTYTIEAPARRVGARKTERL